MINPKYYAMGPTGLEPPSPAGAENRKIATVKIRGNNPYEALSRNKQYPKSCYARVKAIISYIKLKTSLTTFFYIIRFSLTLE